GVALGTTAVGQRGNQGAIEGSVKDPNGGAIVGATVNVQDAARGTAVTATTSAEGNYMLPVLPVGTYTIEVTAPGFTPVSRKNVDLRIGAKLTLDFKLAVSSNTETVNITGEAPVIETSRTHQATTVGQAAIDKLPVNGRNFIDYVLLSPGVTRDVRGGDISFAGQRGTLNSLTVDGVDNNNTFFGQTTGRTGSGRAPYQYSEEAVQEFQVNSNGYSAETGRAGGAAINVVTKSGTNRFHGSAFEYYRDK